MKPKLVTIGMPTMGNIKTFTVMSIINIMASDATPKSFSFPVHTYVHEARRICVEEARQAGATHLFFLDSDMAVKGDVIQKLAYHNKKVVGAMYNERRFPLTNTVKMQKDGVTTSFQGEELPKQLFKCYALGTGCVLIDMEVFDKIEKPWFGFTYFEDGKMDYGEDVFFFDRLHKAGYDVWCDPTIPIKHIGEFAY